MKRNLTHGLGVLRSNASILANSGLLASGSFLSAGLGFVYWWCAAHEFLPAAVGIQSALISAMALVGMLGDAGFSTLLLGESGRRGRDGHSLIAAASVTGSGASLLLAVLAAGAMYLDGWITRADALMFAIGCALTGFSLVTDNGFIGLGHSRLQFGRSLLFALLKLILLLVVGLFTHAASAILLTWVVSLAASLALSCGYAWTRGVVRLVKPDLVGLAREAAVVINHHLLNLSSAAPGLALPLVVSFCLGPSVNAAFYIGWMIRNLTLLIAASLITVLFSLNSPPDVMRQKMRLSLTLSLAVAVAGFFGFLLFGDFALRMFNPAYPSLAGPAMPMLGLSLIGGTVRFHYVLLSRVKRRMRRGAGWLALGGCAEIGLAATGGLLGEVRWLTLGWVIALSMTAAFLARPLVAYLWLSETDSPAGPALIEPMLAADTGGRQNRRA